MKYRLPGGSGLRVSRVDLGSPPELYTKELALPLRHDGVADRLVR